MKMKHNRSGESNKTLSLSKPKRQREKEKEETERNVYNPSLREWVLDETID